MAYMKTQKADIVRLGIEMQYRRCKVAEHPSFGGVTPGVHIANSKHALGRAIDVNRGHLGQRAEDDFFDRCSGEMWNRKFGRIWNRGPGDHDRHMHFETIVSLKENYPGRSNPKRRIILPRLKLDGVLGPATVSEFQKWLGTPVTGDFSERGSTMVKALQAYINTELRTNLRIDGRWGPATTRGLQAVLGTPVDGVVSGQSARHDYPIIGARLSRSPSGSTMVREIQRRLNEKGHIA